jgi:hypothetical protein
MVVVPLVGRLPYATVDIYEAESDQRWRKLARIPMPNLFGRHCPSVAVVEGGKVVVTQSGWIVVDSDVGTSKVVHTASRRKREIVDSHDAATAKILGRQRHSAKLVSSLGGTCRLFATAESGENFANWR